MMPLNLSLSSGVLSLLEGAIYSVRALQMTIQSFPDDDREIDDFYSEIESLIQVLESLENVATGEGPVISVLKLPLLGCLQSCQYVNDIAKKCSEASTSDPLTCFRDRVQDRDLNGGIRGFAEMLAACKSSAAITLEMLNMQNGPAAREAMDRYKGVIEEVTSGLKRYLTNLDEELSIAVHASRQSPDSAANEELARLEQERQSAQHCLLVCENATSFLQTLPDNSPPPNTQPEDSRAETVTALSDARDKVVHMLAELQKQLVALTQKLLSSDTSNQQQQQQQQLEEERLRLLKQIDMAKQCLDACNVAAAQASRQRVHVLDNIVAEANSHQVIVFPAGDLLDVKNVRAGQHSTQWVGSMTDATLQQLSAARAASFTPSSSSSPSHSHSHSHSPLKENDPSFGNKYGLGYRLR